MQCVSPVYKWFNYLKEKHGVKTTGYIIMPNHVHCILFFPNQDYDLSKIVGNGKRFIAYDMVKWLQQKNQTKILLQLKEGLTEKDIAKGQKHKVFEDGFDAKPIYRVSFYCRN